MKRTRYSLCYHFGAERQPTVYYLDESQYHSQHSLSRRELHFKAFPLDQETFRTSDHHWHDIMEVYSRLMLSRSEGDDSMALT